DPDFFQKWIDRYQQLRVGAFSTNNLFNIIDSLANQVRAAQPREQSRWAITPRAASGSGAGTYATEIQWKKNWYASRLDFIDTNFLARPVFSTNAGPIPAGYALTITGPTKPSTIIYYTLNGTDPRLAGGGIS